MTTRTLTAIAFATLLIGSAANTDDCLEGIAMVLPEEAADEGTRQWLQEQWDAMIEACEAGSEDEGVDPQAER